MEVQKYFLPALLGVVLVWEYFHTKDVKVVKRQPEGLPAVYFDSELGDDVHGLGTEESPFMTVTKDAVPKKHVAVLRTGSHHISEGFGKDGLTVVTMPGEIVVLIIDNKESTNNDKAVYYYDSVKGSDVNNGTEAAPFRSLSTIGSTAYLATGRYTLNALLGPPKLRVVTFNGAVIKLLLPGGACG
eukprot:TRINITY_DN2672_c0_g1_i1.p1 TRINITY_DN2672_c0_g1~~TRINITY_DN2672_c0_g1_i1.p1  ORF type:complete len:186 (+),score=85.38 TRINITY_DN2672_c0_g1_i1:76-633(+)